MVYRTQRGSNPGPPRGVFGIRIPKDFNGLQRSSKEFNGLQRISKGFKTTQRISNDFQGFQRLDTFLNDLSMIWNVFSDFQ